MSLNSNGKIVERRINRLFFAVKNEVQGISKAADWLVALEQDANASIPGWEDRLIGFLRGLWAAGVIDLNQVDMLEQIMKSE